jgi:hypothetical protein
MRSTKQRAKSFIAVLPILALTACPQSLFKTSNPPEPTTPRLPEPTTNTMPTTQIVNPSDPELLSVKPVNVNPPPLDPKILAPKLPVAFSKREKTANGKCYVEIYANPPFKREVSCTAPIEPAKEGETWCKVESAGDASKKINVPCDSK